MSGVNRLAELKAARKAKLAQLAAEKQAEEDAQEQQAGGDRGKRSRKGKDGGKTRRTNKQVDDDTDDPPADIEAQKPRRTKPAGKPGKRGGKGGKEVAEEVVVDSDTDDTPVVSTNPEIRAYMKRYDAIKQSLDSIKANTTQLNALKFKSKTASTERAKREIAGQLNEIISSTSTVAAGIKKSLDGIKQENAQQTEKSGTKQQMRTNLYNTYIRRFQSVMTDYNTAASAYKTDLQKRSKREIRIVDPTLSDAKISEIVDSGQAQDVIKQALVSENLNDVINGIESRHLDILKLENQVLEIYELFRDLAVLVDLQQESLDVIETHIVKTQAYTEKAEKDLHEAEDYQKKARSRQCCCIMILMIILVVILAPVLLTQVGHL